MGESIDKYGSQPTAPSPPDGAAAAALPPVQLSPRELAELSRAHGLSTAQGRALAQQILLSAPGTDGKSFDAAFTAAATQVRAASGDRLASAPIFAPMQAMLSGSSGAAEVGPSRASLRQAASDPNAAAVLPRPDITKPDLGQMRGLLDRLRALGIRTLDDKNTNWSAEGSFVNKARMQHFMEVMQKQQVVDRNINATEFASSLASALTQANLISAEQAKSVLDNAVMPALQQASGDTQREAIRPLFGVTESTLADQTDSVGHSGEGDRFKAGLRADKNQADLVGLMSAASNGQAIATAGARGSPTFARTVLAESEVAQLSLAEQAKYRDMASKSKATRMDDVTGQLAVVENEGKLLDHHALLARQQAAAHRDAGRPTDADAAEAAAGRLQGLAQEVRQQAAGPRGAFDAGIQIAGSSQIGVAEFASKLNELGVLRDMAAEKYAKVQADPAATADKRASHLAQLQMLNTKVDLLTQAMPRMGAANIRGGLINKDTWRSQELVGTFEKIWGEVQSTQAKAAAAPQDTAAAAQAAAAQAKLHGFSQGMRPGVWQTLVLQHLYTPASANAPASAQPQLDHARAMAADRTQFATNPSQVQRHFAGLAKLQAQQDGVPLPAAHQALSGTRQQIEALVRGTPASGMQPPPHLPAAQDGTLKAEHLLDLNRWQGPSGGFASAASRDPLAQANAFTEGTRLVHPAISYADLQASKTRGKWAETLTTVMTPVADSSAEQAMGAADQTLNITAMLGEQAQNFSQQINNMRDMLDQVSMMVNRSG